MDARALAADPGAASPPLYGLVLAGGRSARMGSDKAALDYHGRPQAAHACGLLAPFCARVFVSCRADQACDPALAGLPQLHDAQEGLGPLGGILTAFAAHPQAAWLVVACDLPHLDAATLAHLVARRDPSRLATAFAGPLRAGDRSRADRPHGRARGAAPGGTAAPRPPPYDGPESLGPGGELPEPLCAIYEPGMRARLAELMAQGVDCPRKAIIRSSSLVLAPPSLKALENANTPEDRRRALDGLSGG